MWPGVCSALSVQSSLQGPPELPPCVGAGAGGATRYSGSLSLQKAELKTWTRGNCLLGRGSVV